MNEQPLVSLVIPIYNPGSKLIDCLESVESQKYENLDIILVNDGSSDDSDKICKDFLSSDSRITYLVQSNSGVSVARNNGILKAQGKYICFLDADDSLKPDYISCMVDGAADGNPDIVIQGLLNFYNKEIIGGECFEPFVKNVNELTTEDFNKIFYFCGPYCKLFRSEIINNFKLKFPEDLSYGEDLVFYSSYLHHCKKVKTLSEQSYIYSVGVPGSLSSIRLHPESFWANQKNCRREYVQLRRQYGISESFNSEENTIKLIGLKGLLGSVVAHHASLKEYLDKITADADFDFKSMRPNTIKDYILLKLVGHNNIINRLLLSMIFK